MFVCLLAGLALACGGESHEEPVVTAPPVLVTPVELRELVERIEATGELIAKAKASLAAQVDGQVTEVAVDDGSPVVVGQVLLRIDPERRDLEHRNREAGVVEARAQLHEREREAERVRRLSRENAVSQSQLDEAQTNLELARARLAGAEAQLGLARRALADSDVKAPFAGLIARRYVSEGEFVRPGQKLFDVVVLDPVEVEFHLAEVDSGRVEVGDSVDVRVAPHPDEVFRAEVTSVSPTIDPATRTLRVKAVLPNPDGRLRPGLFARADLGVSQRSGVAMVPEEAILQRSDGAVIFRLLEGRRVERLRVETGSHRDGLVEVRAGLQAGDVIVVRGHTSLIDGAVVDVRRADGSPIDAKGSGAGLAADEPRVAGAGQ